MKHVHGMTWSNVGTWKYWVLDVIWFNDWINWVEVDTKENQ